MYGLQCSTEMNSDSAKWMKVAEKLYRREYEITFDTYLSKPDGTIYGFKTPVKYLSFTKEVCAFWDNLGRRCYGNCKGEGMLEELPTLHPLLRSIVMFCMHTESNMNVYLRNEYAKLLKEFINKNN